MTNYRITFTGSGITLHVSESVWNQWILNRQTKSADNESFGVLIGSCSQEQNIFWIESITTPFPLDLSSRHSFQLNDRKHQYKVNQAFESTNGEMIYLGTWHTHPETHPIPSSIDIDDWRSCMKRNPKRQLFFVIVGSDEIHSYILKKNKYIQLNKIETTS